MGFFTQDGRQRGLSRRGVVAVVSALFGVVLLVRSLDGVSAFEGLSLAAVVVGVAVAVGPGRRRASQVLQAGNHHLADLVQPTLAALDPVEHRRLELGEPWPQLVVGPTGVTIIDLCGTDLPPPEPRRGRDRDAGAVPRDCAACRRLMTAGLAVSELLAERHDERTIPVRALAVIPPGAAAPVHDETVATVQPDLLRDAIVRGPVLPMSTVEDVFRFLTQRAAGSWARRR